MRVLSCKSYCSFICSSKSSVSLYSPCPLKFEDVQHAPSSPPPTAHVVEADISDEKADVAKSECDVNKVEVVLKSSLKKPPGSDSTEMEKGGVKWMDSVGKELVEIREFEPIESVDSENNGSPTCICVIQ